MCWYSFEVQVNGSDKMLIFSWRNKKNINTFFGLKNVPYTLSEAMNYHYTLEKKVLGYKTAESDCVVFLVHKFEVVLSRYKMHRLIQPRHLCSLIKSEKNSMQFDQIRQCICAACSNQTKHLCSLIKSDNRFLESNWIN